MTSTILNLLLIVIIDALHFGVCDTGQYNFLRNDNSTIIFLPAQY